MTVERTHRLTTRKPWGVGDARPWGQAGDAGGAIGEVSHARSSLDARSSPALLLKILLTSQPLSIQVHPGDALARSIGQPNGKAEAWYILRAEPGSAVALGLKVAATAAQLREAILDGSIAGMVAWRTVAAGDVVDVPAGTIHAIGAGLVIAEIQQRSDTTFRLFDHGRDRELHLEPSLAAADRAPMAAQAPVMTLSRERVVLVANRYFVYEHVSLAAGSQWRLNATRETWLLVIAGSARAWVGDLEAGDALFAEADDIDLSIGDHGMTGLIAYPGDGGPMRRLLQPQAQFVPASAEPTLARPAPRIGRGPTHEGIVH